MTRVAADVLQATTFPFFAVICLKDGRMQVVERIEGVMAVDALIQRLTLAIETHGHSIATARADRQELDMARRLRVEQDQAYQESLRADQEKERRLRAEREVNDRLARERQDEERARLAAEQRRHQEMVNKKVAREQRRLRRLETLPAEPSLSEPGVCKVVFRLPDGTRLARNFSSQVDTVEVGEWWWWLVAVGVVLLLV